MRVVPFARRAAHGHLRALASRRRGALHRKVRILRGARPPIRRSILRPVRLVIFDCDGVLVDSEPIATRVDAFVLSRLGWPLSEREIVRRFVGRSEEYMVAEIERHLGHPLAPDWEDEYRQLYQDAFAAELRPVDGVVGALDALARMGVPTCVASSGGHAKIEHSLRLCGLYERFAGRIFSAGDVGAGKPAPDLFLHAARAMGAAPAHTVVVEDSPAGVDAALAAGMRVFGYAGGVVPAERLRGATAVFADMRGLPRMIQEARAVTGSRA